MSRINFVFDSLESFREEQSYQFAKYLFRLPSQERSSVLKNFGLSLDLQSKDVRTMYDGKVVGIGSFIVDGKHVSFSIEPKFSDSTIDSVFNTIGLNKNVINNTQISGHDGAFSLGESQGANFTVSFLFKMYEDILHFLNHYLASDEAKERFLKGKIKGRPDLLKSFKHNKVGKQYGFYCRIKEKQDLEAYLTVIMATAKDIQKYFLELKNFDYFFEQHFESKSSRLSSKLKGINIANFSYGLLNRVSKPPFPFGFQKIIQSCRIYWKLRNGIGLSRRSISHLGFWSISISMEKVFEEFVENLLMKVCGESYIVRKKHRFYYHDTKFIEPDFLVVNKEKKQILVIDAKYQEKSATRSQVQQMVSYVHFKYPDDLAGYRVSGGLILHLDSTQDQFIIGNFGADLSFYKLPVSVEKAEEGLRNILNDLI